MNNVILNALSKPKNNKIDVDVENKMKIHLALDVVL